ncbi:MAG TPA: hypothetical protein VF412_10380 [Bdellovibrio sp.]|uniref:hypothetical protein n=1 Tax=Bdellovibrio sp. TaxID=28201 RepID=UPI002EFD5EAE
MRFFILSVLAFPCFAFAGPNVTPDFTCMNELPTTAFYSKPIKNQDGDELVEFKVEHHFGAQNAPIFSGVVTAHDFPMLKEKADVMKKLGNTFTVRFKKVECEKHGDQLFSCGHGDDVEINGVKVGGIGFVTRVVTTKVYEYTMTTNEVNFSFILDGMSYDMPMSFGPDECTFRN